MVPTVCTTRTLDETAVTTAPIENAAAVASTTHTAYHPTLPGSGTSCTRRAAPSASTIEASTAAACRPTWAPSSEAGCTGVVRIRRRIPLSRYPAMTGGIAMMAAMIMARITQTAA